MNSIIEKLFSSTWLGHAAFRNYVLAKQRGRARQAAKLLGTLGHNYLPVEEVLFKPSPEQTECHIIGSGWSLNKSAQLARCRQAYAVGFNSAALIGLRFHSYFLEFAGPGYAELGDHQRQIAQTLKATGDCNIYFKNLCLPHNSVSVAVRKFGDLVSYVQDITLPCLAPKFLEETLVALLEADRQYLRQYMSTAVTMVALAHASGFKKIILHGVDFGGDYFFDSPDFGGDRTLRPPPAGGIYARQGNQGAHVTNKPGIGLQALLPALSGKLKQRGVDLYTAIQDSPSSQILPVWSSSKP